MLYQVPNHKQVLNVPKKVENCDTSTTKKKQTNKQTESHKNIKV